MEQRGDERRRERIAKVIARAGLASRREAERWIAAGRITVNGEVIVTPARDVGAADNVAVDGTPLPRRERTRLFLLHKPRGLLTSHGDPRGRATVFDALPARLPRLISVGRLDLNTEGLLLLTNDGRLARVLELPATGWLRRYRVRAHGSVTQDQLDRLRGGITIGGIRYGPIEAIADRAQGANVWLTFAMREGKNREVKNVLGHLGLAVNRLIRVSFGPFTLGDLAPGEVDEVRTRTLREQLGERLTALADADFSGPRVVADRLSGTIGRTPASLDRGRAAGYEPRWRGKRGGLPPPLRGRAGEGGGAIVTSAPRRGTPTPNPSPSQVGPARLAQHGPEPGQARVRWGGERTETAARSFSKKHSRAGESKRNRADAPERAPREKRRRGRGARRRRQ
jgi:23S rRNA pseudouridine2605 synthase